MAKKFIRVFPKLPPPKHRRVGYVHGLDSRKALSFNEFLQVWKKQNEKFGAGHIWTQLDDADCAFALIWLLENGLAEMVDEDLVH